MKQTKIVASISDRRCDVDFIRQLFQAGINVVRMNTAHATPEGIKEIIRNTRKVSKHIGILIDTKGPEVRSTGTDNPIEYKTGEVVKICGHNTEETSHDCINVSYPDFVNDVKVGDDVLFDDGELDMKVMKKEGDALIVEVQNDGKLGSKKSVNVPGEHIDLPALTAKDKANILLAIEEDIDFIAHSFVRSKEDVLAVQKILDEHNSEIKIISKIENQEGVDNIDEIIEASYGIMIARGDLGIEVPIERIPGIQRMIIKKCIEAKKPVIVATQMLHTMINNPRPTRAEVTDIANAIYYRTDALMLSGETASGKYPVEAVKTTAAIASTERLGVRGIITDSLHGRTARNLAAFRGPNPVLAICVRERVQRLLALSYGVIPVYQHEKLQPQDQFVAALRMLRQKGYLKMEDKIAYLSGSFGRGGGTTFLEIDKVADIFTKDYTLPNMIRP